MNYEFRIMDNDQPFYFTLQDALYDEIPSRYRERIKEDNVERFSGAFDKNGTPIFENDILYSEKGYGLTTGVVSSKRFKHCPCIVKCEWRMEYHFSTPFAWFSFRPLGIEPQYVEMYEKGDYRSHYLANSLFDAPKGVLKTMASHLVIGHSSTFETEKLRKTY